MGSYRTKYKLLLILHFKCSLSFVPLDYVLFKQCTLIFFFYQNLICFIDTSKKQILMKTRNEEKNIKTHKKPKLYPILFLRKYDFQNIEYVILKWISIKEIGIFVDVADSTTTMMTVIYSIYESNGLCLPFANRLCFAVNPIILLNKIVFIYLVITIHMNM